MRHRQTKGAATDMFDLPPPRHISTLRSTRSPLKGSSPATTRQRLYLVDPLMCALGVSRSTALSPAEQLIRHGNPGCNPDGLPGHPICIEPTTRVILMAVELLDHTSRLRGIAQLVAVSYCRGLLREPERRAD